MSIRLVTGEPGAGKSLYVMKQLIDVIRNTERQIVTNMAIKLDPWMLGDKPQMGLRSYLETQFDETFNIDKRITFLEEEMVYEFYRYRGSGVVMDVERDAKGNPVMLDWAKLSENRRHWGDVEFVIDEFWKFAGARDWATTGKALIDWGKQHRKIGDNAWFMSHHHKDIDSAIQRIIETTVCMKNRGRMRVGMFRQPDIFSAAHMQRVPQGAQSPMNTEHFKLDAKGLAQCYDTSGGVGGLKGGTAADTTHKRKGLPFWALILLVILGALAATQFPRLIGMAVGKTVKMGDKAIADAMGVTNREPATSGIPVQSVVPLPIDVPRYPLNDRHDPAISSPVFKSKWKPQVTFDEPVEQVEEAKNVSMTGMGYIPGKGLKIYLSNGKSYDFTEPSVQVLNKEFVVIAGKVYRWKEAVTEMERQAVTLRNRATVSKVE